VFELLGREGIPFRAVADLFPWLRDLPPRVLTQVQADALYSGYLHRQAAEIRAFRREEEVSLAGVHFEVIGGLSTEIREKLVRHRPASLGAASRLQGMTPAALAALAAHVRRGPDQGFT
jgi:tRNA uridine 5-carboxymethylaminomethyl modification enzyme